MTESDYRQLVLTGLASRGCLRYRALCKQAALENAGLSREMTNTIGTSAATATLAALIQALRGKSILKGILTGGALGAGAGALYNYGMPKETSLPDFTSIPHGPVSDKQVPDISGYPAYNTEPAEGTAAPAKDKTVPAKDKTVPAKDKTVPAKDKKSGGGLMSTLLYGAGGAAGVGGAGYAGRRYLYGETYDKIREAQALAESANNRLVSQLPPDNIGYLKEKLTNPELHGRIMAALNGDTAEFSKLNKKQRRIVDRLLRGPNKTTSLLDLDSINTANAYAESNPVLSRRVRDLFHRPTYEFGAPASRGPAIDAVKKLLSKLWKK